MSSYTLLVFEGVTERHVVNNLKNYFIETNENTLVYATFGHSIYQLYSELESDSGLDLFGLLCESIERRNDPNSELLSIESNKISDIFLFFDYDPHNSNASDSKLESMLSVFDNSQEKGQLFVNYPMLESIRHIQAKDYGLITHPISELANYKDFLKSRDAEGCLINVSPDYFNWGMYTKNNWKDIVEINLGRANNLVFEINRLPNEPISQTQILESQQRLHVLPHQRVAIVSAFPLMLHEYYGTKIWNKLSAE